MADVVGSRVKRSRASGPKVKTGCGTCKIRRVKCDEVKPICLRCIKFGVECDGYNGPRKPSAKQLSRPNIHSLTSQQPPLCHTPSSLVFKNEQEHHYFKVFCSRTAHQLSDHFSSTLWQSLVLQACETEAPLRHVVVALGALDSTSHLACQNGPIALRRHFAFCEYSKAISQIRRQVSGQKSGERGAKRDLRSTLIACLLFVCFETINGSLETARAQIYAGVKLLEEWQKDHSQPGNRRTSIFSPRPLVIEDELVHAFGRLELEAMTYRDSRSKTVHEEHRYFGQLTIDNIPATFASLIEARVYLNLIVHRGMHLTAWLQTNGIFNGALSLRNPKVLQGETMKGPELNAFFTQYGQWAQAFEPLWVLSRREEGSELFLGATALRLHYLTACLWRNALAGSREIFYGYSTSELTEIVTLSRAFLASSTPDSAHANPGFVFDIRVIVPLQTVVFVYRHRRLRREAINLLLRKPWREGLWDSWIVGQTAQWIADLEDEDLMGENEVEHVPEEKVLTAVQMDHDAVGRKTTASCLQPRKGKEGWESYPRQVVIPWL